VTPPGARVEIRRPGGEHPRSTHARNDLSGVEKVNMIMIECVMTIALSAVGAGIAAFVRDAVRDRAAQMAHDVWTVRNASIAGKYNRSDYWTGAAPVTLAKRSDSLPRPSWLYDGDNRRMLRADEIKGA